MQKILHELKKKESDLKKTPTDQILHQIKILLQIYADHLRNGSKIELYKTKIFLVLK